jgi:hypothetical protein
MSVILPRGSGRNARAEDGLELPPPEVVQLHHWHPEAAPEEGKLVPAYCGLARKS